MISPRYAPFAFGFILSGLMSLVVSGIATYRTLGLVDGLVGFWIGSWVTSWLVAFPTVLVIAPLTRRIVGHLTRG